MVLVLHHGVWYTQGMDLPLDIIRTRGRAPKELQARVVRELTERDIAALQAEKGSKPPAVKRLRERHHNLARLIASGKTHSEAAVICGYDVSRVSILMADPTFKDLVTFYREDLNRTYAGLHEMLFGMSVDAAIIMRERMEENPDKLKNVEILDIMKMGADRTGYGPAAKQEVNVNVNLADRLQEARKRIAARTIDLTPVKDE